MLPLSFYIMYISTLPHIIYRDYPEYGYLTDNRNFGYDTASKSMLKLGDRLLTKSGSIFYSCLSDTPQSLEDIALRLTSIFDEVVYDDIYKDAVDFFCELAREGYVNYSESNEFHYDRKCYFSYDNKNSLILTDNVDMQSVHEDAFYSSDKLTRVHIDISSLCNEKCVHCYFPRNIKRNIMSKELFLTILDECVNMNVLNITISGGEPMMNPNLILFLKQCKECNFSVNLLTNLSLLNKELLDLFISYPLLSIQTSLYSMDSNIHDSITNVRGSWQKTMDGILMLHRNNIPIQINCPIMRQNMNSYQNVIDWAMSLNIEASSDYLLFGSYDHSCDNLKCRLNLSDVVKVADKRFANSLYLNNFRQEILDRHINDDDKLCPVFASSLCISNSGDVYPCEGWQSLVIGNIKKESLSDMWENNQLVIKLRNLKIKDIPTCKSCENKRYCSICLIKNANENNEGDYTKVNSYFCKVAEIHRNYFEKYDEFIKQ